jgi:hypothetical protein
MNKTPQSFDALYMKYMTTNKHTNWGHRMVEFFITDSALRVIISSWITMSGSSIRTRSSSNIRTRSGSIGTRSGGSGSIASKSYRSMASSSNILWTRSCTDCCWLTSSSITMAMTRRCSLTGLLRSVVIAITNSSVR